VARYILPLVVLYHCSFTLKSGIDAQEQRLTKEELDELNATCYHVVLGQGCSGSADVDLSGRYHQRIPPSVLGPFIVPPVPTHYVYDPDGDVRNIPPAPKERENMPTSKEIREDDDSFWRIRGPQSETGFLVGLVFHGIEDKLQISEIVLPHF
jgi:hypothetical protein